MVYLVIALLLLIGIQIGLFLGTISNANIEKRRKKIYDADIEYLQSQIDFHKTVANTAAEQFWFLKKKVVLKKK